MITEKPPQARDTILEGRGVALFPLDDLNDDSAEILGAQQDLSPEGTERFPVRDAHTGRFQLAYVLVEIIDGDPDVV